jgi:hypothetical protein
VSEERYAMLKKYKNGFIDIIKQQEMDPTSFHAEDSTTTRQLTDTETMEESVFTVQFMDTGLKFVVRNAPYNLHAFDATWNRFDVGFPESPTFLHDDFIYPQDIDTVYEWFVRWLLGEVHVYVDEKTLPDLWAQIEQQRQLVTANRLLPHEISFFTEQEKPPLRTSIRQFRLLVCENFKPTQEQLGIIDERLDYLSKAVDRLNRFDWKSVALNTVLTVVVALSCDTEKGRLLWNLFEQAFAAVMHLLQ